MDTSVIDAVAKYFYFSCLDEQITFTASLKALSELRSTGGLHERSRWVQVLHKLRPRLKQMRGRSFSDKPGLQFNSDFDLNAWGSFLSAGDPLETEAVLLSRVLGIRDGEIATGLGVTVGTVRYRVGRGLRHLGGYLES